MLKLAKNWPFPGNIQTSRKEVIWLANVYLIEFWLNNCFNNPRSILTRSLSVCWFSRARIILGLPIIRTLLKCTAHFDNLKYTRIWPRGHPKTTCYLIDMTFFREFDYIYAIESKRWYYCYLSNLEIHIGMQSVEWNITKAFKTLMILDFGVQIAKS